MSKSLVDILHVMTVPDSFIFLRGQAAFMGAHGIRLGAVAGPGKGPAGFAAEEDVLVRYIALGRQFSPLADLRALVQLIRVMRKLRPRLVQAHTPKGGLLGMTAAFATGVPARIYHMRGLPLETAQGPLRVILSVVERVSCRLAHRVVFESPSLRDRASSMSLVGASKMRVPGLGSGNGVDARVRYAPSAELDAAALELRARHTIPPDAPVAAFVGRIAVDKGFVELAKAWQIAHARTPDAWLLIAGPDDARDGVPASVREALEADPRVVWLGSMDDPRPVYVASQLLLLPSHREGLPNVVLEAAALSRPIITTRATGCRDSIVDGVTGTLVDVGDAVALGRVLSEYLNDAARCKREGAAGRAWVLAEFAPERVWRFFLREYAALLGDPAIAQD